MKKNDETPEIRFKEFTQAWEHYNLEEMVTRYKDLVPTPQNGYWKLSVRSHAKGTYLSYVEAGKQITEANLSKVIADALIFNIVFAWEHAVAITKEEDSKALVSHRFPQFLFHEGFDPKYFEYAITDLKFKEHLGLSSPSGAGRNKTLNMNEALKYRFTVPSFEEQKKIGCFLGKLDDLIMLHEQKLDKLKKMKKSCLLKMFPQCGATVPEVRFSEFEGEWKKGKLSEYLTISNEKNKNEIFGKEDVLSVSGDYGVVNQIEFQGRSFAGASVANYGVVEQGDIVYTKSPLKMNPYGIIKCNCGKTGIVSVLYGVYKPNENVDPYFVQTYFDLDSRLNEYLRPLINKGAKNTILVSDEDALQGKVWFAPTVEEQKKIGDFFRELDNSITKYEQEIKLLNKIKKGCIQKMFV